MIGFPWAARLIALLAGLSTCAFMWADTVTTGASDHVSCNGKVIGLDENGVRLQVRFVDKTEEYLITREAINLIEFNDNHSNQKAPRGPFLLRDPNRSDQLPAKSRVAESNKSPSSDQLDADVVFLKNGAGRKTGHVVSIDSKEVLINGMSAFPRILVHSIQFASKR